MSQVDLSGAEFEAVIEESTTWNGIVLTDNAAINMDVLDDSKVLLGVNTTSQMNGLNVILYAFILNPL